MSSNVRIAFEERIETLPLSQLLPLNAVSQELKQSAKYKQIAKSIAEVGVIEPLVVARSPDQPGHYLLLDGHIRHAVLADACETPGLRLAAHEQMDVVAVAEETANQVGADESGAAGDEDAALHFPSRKPL